MRTLVIGIALAVVCLSVQRSEAASLILNGDFGSGNSGFGSAYTYTDNVVLAGTYYVGADPQAHHGGAASYGDHTSGSGFTLIANGAGAADFTVWEQTVAVDSFSEYALGAWAASWGRMDWSQDPSTDPSPAQLRFLVNGVALGPDFLLPAGNGIWSAFTGTWNSGTASAATIRIVDVNTAGYGNDFTLDDLTFDRVVSQPVPEPSTMLLLASGLAGLAGHRRKRR